jgi:hypothetical protein
MTSDEIVGKLGMRLDREAPESKFGVTERYSYLNDGQLYMAQVLPIDLVRQIETTSTAQAVATDGSITLSSLSPKILNGDRGILSVKHSGGYYCHEILEEDWQRAVEYSLTYTESDPVYYLEGVKLYLMPYAYGTTTGVIRYRAVPTAITDSVASAFGDDVQDMIVDYGVYMGLKSTHGRLEEALAKFRMLEKQVSHLVNLYAPKRRVVFEVGQVLGRGGGAVDGRTMTRY